CNNIAIMNRGRLIEIGTREDIYNHPLHIYTKRLLAAIPETNVNQRAAHRASRLAVEKIYDEQQSKYYDENGEAY
ncbi:ABC transporter ATP-binding protein, partial [Levilactobacillus spicheri]